MTYLIGAPIPSAAISVEVQSVQRALKLAMDSRASKQ